MQRKNSMLRDMSESYYDDLSNDAIWYHVQRGFLEPL